MRNGSFCRGEANFALARCDRLGADIGGNGVEEKRYRSPISSALLRLLRPRKPRPRKPVESMTQVAGSGMGEEPAGPNTAEPRATKRSSEVEKWPRNLGPLAWLEEVCSERL